MNTAPFLEVEHLYIKTTEKSILRDFHCSVRRREILAVVGPSGCGKTTFLRFLGGLLKPEFTANYTQFHIDGEPANGCLASPYRQLLFQNAAATLAPLRMVKKQLLDFYRFNVKKPESPDIVQNRLAAAAKTLGLSPADLEKYPLELSGGMAQRASVLFPFLVPPKLLLADEPTASVDSLTEVKMAASLRQLRQYGTTIVVVTHNLRLAAFLADSLLICHNGRIEDYGTKNEILHAPHSVYTKELLRLAYIGRDIHALIS